MTPDTNPTTAQRFAVECPRCGLYGEPVHDVDDAEQLAGLHDELHHQGQLIADVRPVRQELN